MPQSGFHGLVGLGTVRALIARVPAEARTGFVVGTVLGAVLPDIDMYAVAYEVLTHPKAKVADIVAEYHRSASHSVLFAALLMLGGILCSPKSTWRWALWGTTIGVITHDALDIFFWFAQIDLLWPLSFLPPHFHIVNIWPKSASLSSGIVPNLRDACEFAAFALFLYGLRRIASYDSKLKSKLATQVWWERVLWVYFVVALVTAVNFRNDQRMQQEIVNIPYLLLVLPYTWSRIWVYRDAITAWAVDHQWSWIDWGGSVGCSPIAILYPKTVGEVQAIVKDAVKRGVKIRVFGAGHSWSPLVPTDGILINLDKMVYPEGGPKVDRSSSTVRVTLPGGMRLRDIGPFLIKEGLTFKNLGAITPQSISGAVGTGTHGTGLGFAPIGSQISAAEIIDGKGNLRRFEEITHPSEMAALRLSLGALGIMVSVTIDCVEDYGVLLSQKPMSFDKFMAQFDQLTSFSPQDPDYRVRIYWFPSSDRVLIQEMKRREVKGIQKRAAIYGWFEAYVIRYLAMGFFWWLGRTVNGLIPMCNWIIEKGGYKEKDYPIGHCFYAITTPIPPKHQEAEVAVPLKDAKEAILAYRDKLGAIRNRVNVQSEIRFCCGDDALLSPVNRSQADSGAYCWIGGYTATYIPNDPFFDLFCNAEIHENGILHWGKIGAPNRAQAIKYYGSKFHEFAKIRTQLDPHGVFANDYITELFDLVH